MGTAPQATQPPASTNADSAPAASVAPAPTGIESTWGPAMSTARQSAVPQQCTPVTAKGSMTASAPDTRSTTVVGGQREPQLRRAHQGRLVEEHHQGCRGARSVAREMIDRARSSTACLATRKATSSSSPAIDSARPSVTGPVSWTLIGAVRRLTASRNARRVWNGSPSRVRVGERRLGVDRGDGRSRARPVRRAATPRIPQAAWAIIPSNGDRCGRVGAAGRSAWVASTNCTAAVDVGVGQAPDRGRPADLERWLIESVCTFRFVPVWSVEYHDSPCCHPSKTSSDGLSDHSLFPRKAEALPVPEPAGTVSVPLE